MRIHTLLIAIIILLAGTLAYEFWRDGRLPFVQGGTSTVAGRAQNAAETPIEPTPPTAIIMQCEGGTDVDTFGLRSPAENGAHYFTLRIQRDGATEATNLVGSAPVDRGRWTGQISEGSFGWSSRRTNDFSGYSSDVHGTLNLESGEYEASLIWAPMGIESRYYYTGYCRAAAVE